MTKFAVSLLGLALLAPSAHAVAISDLTPMLQVSPGTVDAGATIEIVSEIRHVGSATGKPLGSAGAGSDATIYLLKAADAPGGIYLASWAAPPGLAPGASAKHTNLSTIPASTIPGAYYVCIDVDAAQAAAESNETNNRACQKLTVTAASGVKPDLSIVRVSVKKVRGISRPVSVRVKNSGKAPAVNFAIQAFGADRSPIMFTACPPRGRDESPACGAVAEAAVLPAGAVRTYSGYITFPPGYRKGSGQRIEFVADACPQANVPCRVVETNETNNGRATTVKVP